MQDLTGIERQPMEERNWPDIIAYHNQMDSKWTGICQRLYGAIEQALPEAEARIWHGHPVWFIEGNPIVGYSLQKPGIRLMFWSGAGFDEEGLTVRGEKFKDASVFYTDEADIDPLRLNRWLGMSRDIQWDYKNLVKRKEKLERLK